MKFFDRSKRKFNEADNGKLGGIILRRNQMFEFLNGEF